MTSADVVVGTFAGWVVGAHPRSGTSIEELYADQLEESVGEVAARMGANALVRSGMILRDEKDSF